MSSLFSQDPQVQYNWGSGFTSTIVMAEQPVKGHILYQLYSPEDVKLLKWLRHRMLMDLIATRRFERWMCKFPKHRKGPRPICYGTKAYDYEKVCKEYILACMVWENVVAISYSPTSFHEKQVNTISGVIHRNTWIALIKKYQDYDSRQNTTVV